MALPKHPNRISLGDIQREFNEEGGGVTRLSEYYSGKDNVPDTQVGFPKGVQTPIPKSGRISLGNFHGADKGYLVWFTESGVFVVPSGITRISVLLLGAGGSGGAGLGLEGGGGGGAGGLLLVRDLDVESGETIAVSVGQPVSGDKGGDTSFRGIVAAGGGRGGSGGSGWGGHGGSGGGGMGYYGSKPGGTGIPGQGNNGAYGYEESRSGGGGGAGSSATDQNGGRGRDVLFNGKLILSQIASGGGAGSPYSGVAGSSNGGNGAINRSQTGGSAVANTGSGGGGGAGIWKNSGTRGGLGGSGIVIIAVGGFLELR